MYYYKDNNNGYYAFKEEHFIKYVENERQETITNEDGTEEIATIIEQVPNGLEDGYTEITEQEWNEHIDSITPKEPTQEQIRLENIRYQISALKQELATYDYIGVKIAMGVATKEEYAEQIAYTQTLRRQVNELEAQL